ncbi:PRC-barrel domain-containing protein [Herpetosiphon llansteffanensis]|uniref:PRC-barrel domain-containing protein n=1 Tax=Herpetosiphon llansteffanensis TaxID=2094568 RepID=UPI000D7CBFF0|nr:PRC-barrel domain-containing protein [Herpetosiphon llansteffanensis]
MYTVNSLFGKPVIAQATGERIASVQDVVLDQPPTRVVALLIDIGGLLSSARVIRWEQVISLGDVALVSGDPLYTTIKEDPELAALIKQAHQITGTTIITVDGTQIGTVADLSIDERGTILGYQIKQGFFQDLRGRSLLPVEQVRSFGNDAIIVEQPPQA